MKLGDLTSNSILKFTFACAFPIWLLLGLFWGMVALFGGEGVLWNGAPVTGLTGLALAVATSAAFAAFNAFALLLGGLLARLLPAFRRIELNARERTENLVETDYEGWTRKRGFAHLGYRAIAIRP